MTSSHDNRLSAGNHSDDVRFQQISQKMCGLRGQFCHFFLLETSMSAAEQLVMDRPRSSTTTVATHCDSGSQSRPIKHLATVESIYFAAVNRLGQQRPGKWAL